jgi:hypothetical protein
MDKKEKDLKENIKDTIRNANRVDEKQEFPGHRSNSMDVVEGDTHYDEGDPRGVNAPNEPRDRDE